MPRSLLPAFVVILACLCTSCTSIRLASRDPLPAGAPIRGPQGGYELTPPGEHWVRADWNERDNIDLALARQTGDAWVNVSVLPGRFESAEQALGHARAHADALMVTFSRSERAAVVPSPDGDRIARMGVYCGTFDREMRSRDSCFVLLTVLRDDTTYALVAQVRVKDPEPGRQDEVERLVQSLRLVDSPAAGPAGENSDE